MKWITKNHSKRRLLKFGCCFYGDLTRRGKRNFILHNLNLVKLDFMMIIDYNLN